MSIAILFDLLVLYFHLFLIFFVIMLDNCHSKNLGVSPGFGSKHDKGLNSVQYGAKSSILMKWKVKLSQLFGS